MNSTSLALGGPNPVYSFCRLFGDINGDGTVNTTDYNQFLTAYNTRIGHPGYVAAFDYNGDGRVNNADYNVFLSNYGITQTALDATDLYYSSNWQVLEEDQVSVPQTQ